jgi:hypothetical protein
MKKSEIDIKSGNEIRNCCINKGRREVDASDMDKEIHKAAGKGLMMVEMYPNTTLIYLTVSGIKNYSSG